MDDFERRLDRSLEDAALAGKRMQMAKADQKVQQTAESARIRKLMQDIRDTVAFPILKAVAVKLNAGQSLVTNDDSGGVATQFRMLDMTGGRAAIEFSEQPRGNDIILSIRLIPREGRTSVHCGAFSEALTIDSTAPPIDQCRTWIEEQLIKCGSIWQEHVASIPHP